VWPSPFYVKINDNLLREKKQPTSVCSNGN
jgi:hypothetical protein